MKQMKFKSILLTASLTLGLTAATIAQVPYYVPTNGLVGWWPFNGNANDESGNNLNGDVFGSSLTSDRYGAPSSAYSFDGQDDYIFMGSIPSLSTVNNNGFTMALWFNSNTYSGLNTDLYDLRSNNISSNQILINNCGNGCIQSQNFDFPNWVSSGYTNGGFAFFVSNNFTINNWVFVVCSQNYSTNENKLYVNGILSNDTICQHINLFNPNLNIGSRYDPQVNPPQRCCSFSGSLDDIAIYNRALTQQEIISLYNTTITGLNPTSNQNILKVFPNPANSQLTIDYGNFSSMSGYRLKIVNSIGQTVFTTLINQQSTYIDISSWKVSGIYNVQLIDTVNNTIENRKIVIQ
jgi:hypothetical protein